MKLKDSVALVTGRGLGDRAGDRAALRARGRGWRWWTCEKKRRRPPRRRSSARGPGLALRALT